jgi:hypothetical protein
MDPNQFARLKEQEFAIYDQEVGNANDPKLSVLLSHLYVEHLLERYLNTKLKASDGLFNKSGLTFENKLSLVQAFGEIDDQLADGIRKLNGLRNDCVHKFKHQPSQKQIDDFGRTFGKAYKEIKSKYPNDKHHCLGAFIARLCGEALTLALFAEHPLLPNRVITEKPR